MKHKTPVIELQRMTPDELRRELTLKRAEAAKMRIAIGMQSEKNHALYRAHRRDIARMTMVLGHMNMTKNPTNPKKPTKPKNDGKKSSDSSVSSASSVSSEKASQKAKKPVKDAGSKKVKSKKAA